MKLFVVMLFAVSASAIEISRLYLPPQAPSSSNSTKVPTFSLVTQALTPVPSPTIALTTPTVLYGTPVVKTYSIPVQPIPILRISSTDNTQGTYSFEYETANHIIAQESGSPKPPDSSEVKGFYSYLAPNGETITLSYVADENGFRPTGEHLPTPPPVPAAILKSLEFNAAEEAKRVVVDGQSSQSPVQLVVSKQIVAPSVVTKYLPPGPLVVEGYKY